MPETLNTHPTESHRTEENIVAVNDKKVEGVPSSRKEKS